MRRPLLLASIVLALPLLGGTARGDWDVRVGIGVGGARVEGRYHRQDRYPRHLTHRHVATPIHEKVWVPPVHRRVVVGRTAWGAPVFRSVVVRPGYYRLVIVGHRCRQCGCTLP
jgi:hypothetical protein